MSSTWLAISALKEGKHVRTEPKHRIAHHRGGKSASMETCAASGWISLSCSSSPVASSYCGETRGRRKRDELARESLNERKSRVRERVVGVVVDDEAIAVPVASSARSGGRADSGADGMMSDDALSGVPKRSTAGQARARQPQLGQRLLPRALAPLSAPTTRFHIRAPSRSTHGDWPQEICRAKFRPWLSLCGIS